jgi:prepilin-type N-terminal cleavage/methylation domain-containing protein
MRRRGFVLIEILVVVTILAVLGIIAIPAFAKAKYKTEKNQAISYLRVIRTAEKLYWARGDAVLGVTKTYKVCANTAAINTQFGTEIKLTNWTFAVTVPTSTTFVATATSDAASGSKTIILTETWVDEGGGVAYWKPVWSGTYTPLPSV